MLPLLLLLDCCHLTTNGCLQAADRPSGGTIHTQGTLPFCRHCLSNLQRHKTARNRVRLQLLARSGHAALVRTHEGVQMSVGQQ
jgi:hypothetical protein